LLLAEEVSQDSQVHEGRNSSADVLLPVLHETTDDGGVPSSHHELRLHLSGLDDRILIADELAARADRGTDGEVDVLFSEDLGHDTQSDADVLVAVGTQGSLACQRVDRLAHDREFLSHENVGHLSIERGDRGRRQSVDPIPRREQLEEVTQVRERHDAECEAGRSGGRRGIVEGKGNLLGRPGSVHRQVPLNAQGVFVGKGHLHELNFDENLAWRDVDHLDQVSHVAQDRGRVGDREDRTDRCARPSTATATTHGPFGPRSPASPRAGAIVVRDQIDLSLF